MVFSDDTGTVGRVQDACGFIEVQTLGQRVHQIFVVLYNVVSSTLGLCHNITI